jgi:hypothetical protein
MPVDAVTPITFGLPSGFLDFLSRLMRWPRRNDLPVPAEPVKKSCREKDRRRRHQPPATHVYSFASITSDSDRNEKMSVWTYRLSPHHHVQDVLLLLAEMHNLLDLLLFHWRFRHKDWLPIYVYPCSCTVLMLLGSSVLICTDSRVCGWGRRGEFAERCSSCLI